MLTEGTDTFNLSQDDMVHILTSGTGSKVLYYDGGAGLKEKTVVEAPASIAAMTSDMFLVTPSDGSGTSYINASRMVYALVEGSGSKISYDVEGPRNIDLIVDEAVSALRTASGNLVTVTPTSGTATIDLNSANIEIVDDEGTGSVVMYDQGGATLTEYVVTESKGNINKQIFVNAGRTVYAITAVSTGSKTFTIAENGSAIFTVAKVLQVVDSTGNDATYTVLSSTGSGPTVITVNETVADATVDGDILIVV